MSLKKRSLQRSFEEQHLLLPHCPTQYVYVT